jgi:integrase
LTTADTDNYRAARAGVTFQTVNRELGYLRAALRRETRTTPPRVTSIPYMSTPSEKDCVREGFIDRDDYKKLLEYLPASLRAIFVCAFHTGARLGELKQITWPQVNFARRVIEIRAKTAKNSEGRWLPIWGDMAAYLTLQKATRDRDFPDCPYVFFWQYAHHVRATPGQPLTDFRWAWGDACRRAGFPGLLFHDLRRSAIKFADQEAGINTGLVRLMSGHKSDSVFQRYNIRGGRDAEKLAEALDAALTKQATR